MKPELRLKKEVRENEKLYKFLVENEAYDKFMENTINFTKNVVKPEGFIIAVIRRSPNPILDAFTWNVTSEGREYWQNLYENYKNLK